MVEIQVWGIQPDCAKHKSKVISRNAVNPIWSEGYRFQVGWILLEQTLADLPRLDIVRRLGFHSICGD
jgi:hypothetical protein